VIEKGREGGRIAVKSSVRTKQVVKTVGGRTLVWGQLAAKNGGVPSHVTQKGVKK
jgi:hypothetical protein